MAESFSIHAQAAALGFDACGVARSRELTGERERLGRYLAQGRHGGLGYLERNVETRLDPSRLVTGARSVVVCGLAYKRAPHPNPLLGRIASYAWGADYHEVIREKLTQLLAALKNAYPGSSGRVFVDTAPLLEKSWAVEAGLGWIGRNSLLTHPRLGSYLMLGVIVTDAELPADTPYSGPGCGSCRACVEACPAGALGEDRMPDAGRCVSRRTIEESAPGEEGELHGWLFGCDACLRACPFNAAAPVAAPGPLSPLPPLEAMEAEDWLELDEARFEKLFSKSPLSRCGLRRLQERIRSRKDVFIK